GWMEIFDYNGGATHKDWVHVNWSAYNSANGETRPACGDVDGDGNDEIVVGLGTYTTNGGWMPILDDHAGGYSVLDWVHVNWSIYNSANGETRPQFKKGSGTAGSAVSYQLQAQTSMQDGPPLDLAQEGNGPQESEIDFWEGPPGAE
ncbi:MAG: hypothetical protein LWX01_03630, partial [Deltaproteobacteria bacterium]|nr:hypothetical protein [Deltaproteobacteria bacterium]MDL1960779.1 hypothetical protein [Deltaproteobacteria bacterium]